MIFKSDLVDAINGLSHDLTNLSIRVHDLERNIAKLDSKMLQLKKDSCSCKLDKAVDSCKAKKAKAQPRDKSGKFAKK